MEDRLVKLILNKTSPEDCFDIEYKGKTLELGIRPLSGRTIMLVNEQILKCRDIVDSQQTIFCALLENSDNLKYIVKAIAICTETKKLKLVTKAILNLDLKQIEMLWNIVLKNSNADFFLRIMASAKQMNFMKKKQETEE